MKIKGNEREHIPNAYNLIITWKMRKEMKQKRKKVKKTKHKTKHHEDETMASSSVEIIKRYWSLARKRKKEKEK